MKKLIALSLLLCLMLSAAACSKAAGSSQDSTKIGDAEASVEGETTIDGRIYDSLPADLDLEGKNVTFFYREEIANEFWIDEQSGEIVEDAIYSSFLKVEERLGCDIEVLTKPGHYVEARQDYMNTIKQAAMAGDSTYDWADAMIGNFAGMLADNTFADISSNPYLDFDKPWWLKGIVYANSPAKGIYFVSGDSSLGYFNDAFCLFYNVSLAQTVNISTEELFATIEDNEWTYDVLLSMIPDIADDIDGNGKFDINDRIGFVCHNPMHLRGIVLSCDAKFVTNTDETWKLTYGSEHDFDVIAKLNELLFGSDSSLNLNVNDAVNIEAYNEVTSKYKEGNILFMTAQLSEIMSLRDMEDDYTVIVLPKYDDSQQSYVTTSRNTHNAFGLVTTSADPDAACAVMEALSCEKFNMVIPTYYETALKEKYSRSPEMTRMLDIIHDSMQLSLDYVYNNSFGSPLNLAIDMLKTPDKFYSNLTSWQKSIDTQIENFVLYKIGRTA